MFKISSYLHKKNWKMIFSDEQKENEPYVQMVQLGMLDTNKILSKVATNHDDGSFVREQL
jgi:hypothetical protein